MYAGECLALVLKRAVDATFIYDLCVIVEPTTDSGFSGIRLQAPPAQDSVVEIVDALNHVFVRL